MNYVNENLTRKKWTDAKLIKSGLTKILPFSVPLDLPTLHKTADTEIPTDDVFGH